MSNEEIMKNFIITGKAIYKICIMDAENEGLEVPDSITVSATDCNDDIIEITITIKKGDTNEIDNN